MSVQHCNKVICKGVGEAYEECLGIVSSHLHECAPNCTDITTTDFEAIQGKIEVYIDQNEKITSLNNQQLIFSLLQIYYLNQEIQQMKAKLRD